MWELRAMYREVFSLTFGLSLCDKKGLERLSSLLSFGISCVSVFLRIIYRRRYLNKNNQNIVNTFPWVCDYRLTLSRGDFAKCRTHFVVHSKIKN